MPMVRANAPTESSPYRTEGLAWIDRARIHPQLSREATCDQGAECVATHASSSYSTHGRDRRLCNSSERRLLSASEQPLSSDQRSQVIEEPDEHLFRCRMFCIDEHRRLALTLSAVVLGGLRGAQASGFRRPRVRPSGGSARSCPGSTVSLTPWGKSHVVAGSIDGDRLCLGEIDSGGRVLGMPIGHPSCGRSTWPTCLTGSAVDASPATRPLRRQARRPTVRRLRSG